MYSRTISSSRPLLTQQPRAQNVRPRTIRLLFVPKLITSDALLPFKRPMAWATLYLGCKTYNRDFQKKDTVGKFELEVA
jgi:hypothetical protein